MITLDDIAYVRSGAADLQNAVRFAVDVVGLELLAQENGTAYLRGHRRPPAGAPAGGRPDLMMRPCPSGTRCSASSPRGR